MSNFGQDLRNAIVVISDFVEPRSDAYDTALSFIPSRIDKPVLVRGGYLERLPLAAVASGLCQSAEIWHFHRGTAIASFKDAAGMTRRAFPVDGEAPFLSSAMIEFIATYGAPSILCVWGLGVAAPVLEACARSTIIYNSIDVLALRVPPEVSRHFDLVLTGAQWQSVDVLARHPDMPTAVLPIGPDFAAPETFFPIAGTEKSFDVVYVAAAQPYKRHDILFDAIARSSQPLSALCVIGYGEDAQRLRDEARDRNLNVEFIGPPGVSHDEVNRLINQARVGVVCGVDDGAPAILTEYMLAGLPVVANAALRCGLQYVVPDTGIAVAADQFDLGIAEALRRTDFSPRQTVLDRWTWPHSISKLAGLIATLETRTAPHQPQHELV